MPGLAQDNLRILQEVHTSLKLFCNTDFGYNKFTNEQILWNVVFWSNQKRKFTSEIQKYSHFLYKEVSERVRVFWHVRLYATDGFDYWHIFVFV